MLWSTKFKNQSAFSLLEIIIALGIFTIISTAIITLFQLGIRITTDDKAKNGALAIAQEQMEIIKNLPYNDIGMVGGVPSGELENSKTETLNKIDYSVTTDIQYIDDPFDGLVSEGDLLNIDYKQIYIEVSWNSKLGTPPVTLVSYIAPTDIEQAETEDTGTLWLEVYDSTATAVANADVSIINNDVSPTIAINSKTDTEGIYLLPSAPAATQTYQISITKNGYSTDQTYEQNIITNPNPDPAHLSIDIDDITTKSFFIDQLSTLNITAKTFDTEETITNFPFTLTGEKTTGTDGDGNSIYKYSTELTTNETGEVNLTNMEYDIYSLEFDNFNTGYDIAGSDSFLPFVLNANTTTNLNIFLAPHTTNTLLLNITDATDLPVTDASVRLYKTDLSYDQTQTSSIYGQAFFTPLDSDTYNLLITKAGYLDYTLEINVSDQTQQTIILSTS